MSGCAWACWIGMILCIACAPAAYGAPNFVFLLTDDLGFNAPGYRNPDLITPTLDTLAADGLKLDSLYTYKFCAPTRGSLLTGRLPYHLPAVRSNFIPTWIPDGIDLAYDMLPKKLAAAGYTSHHVGKWHQGFFSPAYLPVSRGFNTSFGFLEGGEDHNTQQSFGEQCTGRDTDLYNGTQPAYGRNGTYTAYMFTQRAVEIVREQAESKTPFFLYFALHNTHAPVEAPPRFVEKYSFKQALRNHFDAMVSVVDESVRNVTQALKATGLWNNTLVVWMTDNGSPVQVAGSNAPLRGGKGSNWEGGVRVPGFVTGGLLPDSMRGRTVDGLVHIADWYTTFCTLAGVAAAGPGPAPLEGVDVWPYLSGQAAASPRTAIVHDHRMFTNETTGALRVGDWKLIVGGAGGEAQASWYGNFTPNGTVPSIDVYACTGTPCLFNIKDDPTEHVDRAASEPDVLQQLQAQFAALAHTYHPPRDDPTPERAGYCGAIRQHRGFVAPWHV